MFTQFFTPWRVFKLAAMLVLPAVSAAQTFGVPQPAPYPGGGAPWSQGEDGGVYGGFNGGVNRGANNGTFGGNYDGLRVDGYPSNRNLNLDDRTPRLGPTLPNRRDSEPQPYRRFGNGAAGFGSVQPLPDAARGEGWRQRGY